MLRPSGDQLGSTFQLPVRVSWRWWAPSASMTQTWYAAPTARTNAIRAPSGDQAGYESFDAPLVRRRSPLPFAFITTIVPRVSPIRPRANAIRAPSGDQAG